MSSDAAGVLLKAKEFLKWCQKVKRNAVEFHLFVTDIELKRKTKH